VCIADVDFPVFVEDQLGEPFTLCKLDGRFGVRVSAGRRADDELGAGIFDEEDRGRVDRDDFSNSLEQLAEHAFERKLREDRPGGDALQAYESLGYGLGFTPRRTLPREEDVALITETNPFQRMLEAFDDRLEQRDLPVIEGLVVETSDADGAARHVAGERREHELADSGPEQVPLAALRLLIRESAST
jgi:hypothetical protein